MIYYIIKIHTLQSLLKSYRRNSVLSTLASIARFCSNFYDILPFGMSDGQQFHYDIQTAIKPGIRCRQVSDSFKSLDTLQLLDTRQSSIYSLNYNTNSIYSIYWL